MMEVLSRISCLRASFLCFVLWLKSTKGKGKHHNFGLVFLRGTEFREKWRFRCLAKKKGMSGPSLIGWQWTILTLRRNLQLNTGFKAFNVMTLSPPMRALSLRLCLGCFGLLRLGFGLLLKHWQVQLLAPKPASIATICPWFWYACFALKLADVLDRTQVNTILGAVSTRAQKSLLSIIFLCVTTFGKMNWIGRLGGSCSGRTQNMLDTPIGTARCWRNIHGFVKHFVSTGTPLRTSIEPSQPFALNYVDVLRIHNLQTMGKGCMGCGAQRPVRNMWDSGGKTLTGHRTWWRSNKITILATFDNYEKFIWIRFTFGSWVLPDRGRHKEGTVSSSQTALRASGILKKNISIT